MVAYKSVNGVRIPMSEQEEAQLRKMQRETQQQAHADRVAEQAKWDKVQQDALTLETVTGLTLDEIRDVLQLAGRARPKDIPAPAAAQPTRG